MIIRQIALGDIAGKTGKDRRDRAGCSGVIAAAPIDTEPAFDAADQTGNKTGRTAENDTGDDR